LQWAWVFLNREYFQVTYKGSISFSYLSFYFVGAYLGIYYEQILEKMKSVAYRMKVIIPLVAGYLVLVVMYTGYMYLVRTGQYTEISAGLPGWVNSNIAEFTWATHALLAGLVLFFAAYAVKDRLSLRSKTFFMEIGATSFGIYLIHPLFLIFFRKLLPGGSPIVFHGWQVFTFIAISLISWAVVRLSFKWIPSYWVFFGKLAPFKAYKLEGKQKAS
jgi:probable poly-beta-1,6-N-acetyl-D-glucosamine export protein